MLAAAVPAVAQQHRAVRLGHPLTRFAPPLMQPEQLRALFAEQKLREDVAEILRQAKWKGNVEDLRHAAAVAPVVELSLPIGTRMPFMASRKDGKPEALIDVLWDGEAPVSAYAFDFTSSGRLCRCITPRPCSNFYVVDLGPAQPALALACTAPGQALLGRRFDVCIIVTNLGTAPEPSPTLHLQIPAGATLAAATDQGTNVAGDLQWNLPELQPSMAKQVCATFVHQEAALVSFAALARETSGKETRTHCDTQVIGIPAILLDTADLEDPVEVGKQVVYEIKVTNQGSAVGTNLKVICSLPNSEEFVSGTGPTPVQAQDRTVRMDTLPVLAPKELAVWRVTVKALKPDDARFKVFISTDQFQQPIQKDEATQLY
jgi:uncharacterized repeat protein (TIGR01451 family)